MSPQSKFPGLFFTDIEKDLKMYMEIKRIAQTILNKIILWRCIIGANLKVYYRAIVIKITQTNRLAKQK